MAERIPTRFRWALAAKGALLLGMGAVFAALAWKLTAGVHGWLVVRVALALGFCACGAFLAGGAVRDFADAWIAEARQTEGAVALASRRAGYSLRLPDGHFVEFILHNPWQPLRADARYTVTYGRFSRVLVAPPRLETPASAERQSTAP